MNEWLGELLGEFAWLIFLLFLFIIVGIAYVAKLFWDRLGEGIQQSVIGNWYKRRPWQWQATLSIVSIISLLFLFWCLCVYGVTILLGFAYVSGVVYISVLVSFPFFLYLILGACWSISERLQREGLDKQTVQIGFPLIAFGILILLLIAFGVAGIVLGTVFMGIVIGTTYFISMLLFIRAGKLRMELAELKDKLGRGAITQEEYEQKKKLLESEKLKEGIPMLSRKVKLIAIFVVIIAITVAMLFFPIETILCLWLIEFPVLGYFLFVTLDLGWLHPTLYVRVYTAFVAIPSALFLGGLLLFGFPLFFEGYLWAYIWLIFGITPLIPLWYVWHKKCGKEKIPLWYPLRYKEHRK